MLVGVNFDQPVSHTLKGSGRRQTSLPLPLLLVCDDAHADVIGIFAAAVLANDAADWGNDCLLATDVKERVDLSPLYDAERLALADLASNLLAGGGIEDDRAHTSGAETGSDAGLIIHRAPLEPRGNGGGADCAHCGHGGGSGGGSTVEKAAGNRLHW